MLDGVVIGDTELPNDKLCNFHRPPGAHDGTRLPTSGYDKRAASPRKRQTSVSQLDRSEEVSRCLGFCPMCTYGSVTLPDVAHSLDTLGKAAEAPEVLTARSQRLVKLGIAIGTLAEGAVRSNVRRPRR